jgi:membrane protease YdiL (CAAX protease family)
VTVVVTGLVTAASYGLPPRWVATTVGLVFFGVTWLLVWQKDDAKVEAAGLAFGGLVMPGKLDTARLMRDVREGMAWACGLALLSFLPFYVGWRVWAHFVWHARDHFVFSVQPLDALNEVAGQLIIIAVPEEAFYRGYLQTRLDDVWAPRVRVLGANVGPSLLVASAVFALGHLATKPDPGRLAVFFPSLVFGWLRARTRGVGASIAFHAACNLFSEMLMRGYGVH